MGFACHPAAAKEILGDLYEWAAALSPDPSTQNAAILVEEKANRFYPSVETVAVNEFPRGVAYNDERWERPLKYAVIEHAERNAIFRAARFGIATVGMTMICPWAACADCARAIIQAGIVELVTHKQASDHSPERWLESIEISKSMFQEAGVKVTEIDDDSLCEGLSIRHNGKLWFP